MFDNLSSFNFARYYPSRLMDFMLRGNELFTMMNNEAAKAMESANVLPPGGKEYIAEVNHFRNRAEFFHLMGEIFADLLQMKAEDMVGSTPGEPSKLDKRFEKFRTDATLVYDRFEQAKESQNNEWARKIEEWWDDMGKQWAERMSSSHENAKKLTKEFSNFWNDFFDTPVKTSDDDYSAANARMDEFFVKCKRILGEEAVDTKTADSE